MPDPDPRPYRGRAEIYAMQGGKVYGGLYKDTGAFGVFGGGIDDGESASEAAAREFLEETGRRVENVRRLDISPVTSEWLPPYPTPKLAERAKKYRGSKTYFLVGELVTGKKEDVDEQEKPNLKAIRLYTLDEAMKLTSPKTDSKELTQLGKKRKEVLQKIKEDFMKNDKATEKSAFVEGFLWKCRELGLSDLQIQSSVQKAAAIDPFIADELKTITSQGVKQSSAVDLGTRIGLAGIGATLGTLGGAKLGPELQNYTGVGPLRLSLPIRGRLPFRSSLDGRDIGGASGAVLGALAGSELGGLISRAVRGNSDKAKQAQAADTPTAASSPVSSGPARTWLGFGARRLGGAAGSFAAMHAVPAGSPAWVSLLAAHGGNAAGSAASAAGEQLVAGRSLDAAKREAAREALVSTMAASSGDTAGGLAGWTGRRLGLAVQRHPSMAGHAAASVNGVPTWIGLAPDLGAGLGMQLGRPLGTYAGHRGGRSLADSLIREPTKAAAWPALGVAAARAMPYLATAGTWLGRQAGNIGRAVGGLFSRPVSTVPLQFQAMGRSTSPGMWSHLSSAALPVGLHIGLPMLLMHGSSPSTERTPADSTSTPREAIKSACLKKAESSFGNPNYDVNAAIAAARAARLQNPIPKGAILPPSLLAAEPGATPKITAIGPWQPSRSQLLGVAAALAATGAGAYALRRRQQQQNQVSTKQAFLDDIQKHWNGLDTQNKIIAGLGGAAALGALANRLHSGETSTANTIVGLGGLGAAAYGLTNGAPLSTLSGLMSSGQAGSNRFMNSDGSLRTMDIVRAPDAELRRAAAGLSPTQRHALRQRLQSFTPSTFESLAARAANIDVGQQKARLAAILG